MWTTEDQKQANKRWLEKNREEQNARARERYKLNREKELDRGKLYRQLHYEEVKARARIHAKKRYETHREEILARGKISSSKNKDKIRARKKAYHSKNREKILAGYKAYHQKHKDQFAARWKVYYAKHKQRLSENKWLNELGRKYQLTRAEYESLLESQSGACASCNETPGPSERLAVDHDHLTGVVRGLLCRGCNVALGYVSDSPERLEALAAYLRKHAQFHLVKRQA